MSGFRVDLLANLAGVGWSALAQVVCIPFYLKFLGIEAFGLIGFYLVLQALFQVLDFGLSPTINRELARFSVQPEKAAEARDLVRTLEAGYWLVGIGIGAALFAAAPLVSTHWIKAGSLPIPIVRQAVRIMGILAFFQWPVSFYQGGLLGLRRQVLSNSLKVFAVTLSNGGAVLVLWRLSPSIRAFLSWQAAAGAAYVVFLAIALWKSLPPADRAPRFDFGRVRTIWRFAAGMSGITLLSLILTQIDKLIVSRLLSLQLFGYYTLAWTVASGLLVIAGAVFNVAFPRMSAQVAAGDENAIRRSYHRGSQLMAVVILPLAGILSFFAYDVLRLWIRNGETAANAGPILAVLAIGSALNALLYFPYILQLAFGWTDLNLVAGVASIAVVVPAMFPMIRYFGPVGAASMWAVLNLLNMLITVPIMHRRLLPGELWKYFGDVSVPLACVTGMAVVGRWLFSSLDSPVTTITALSSLWLASSALAVLAAPLIRERILSQFRRQRPLYA